MSALEPPQKEELSQKEYLKRYLSKDKGDKKKKKKIKISSSSHLKRSIIIDDDLGLPSMASVEDEEFNFDYLGDEAPQIAGIVDERPPEIKAKENYGDGSKWKPVGEQEDSEQTQKNNHKFLEKDSRIPINGKSTFEDSYKKKYSDASSLKTKSGKDNFPAKERVLGIIEIDSDASPTRSKNKDGKRGSRYKKYDKDDGSDLSPPRIKTKDAGYDRSSKNHLKGRGSYSPHRMRDKFEKKLSVKRISKGSDSDLSPPRQKKYEEKIKRRRHDFENDFSNTRKSRHEGKVKRRSSDSDLSPPRKKNFERKSKRKGSDSEFSPPRKNKYEGRIKRNESDSDLSPPRRRKHERQLQKRYEKRFSPKRNKQETKENMKNMDKTLDGKKAGLQDAKNLKEELRKLKEAENIMFQKMRASVSGKTASAVIRDKKTGKIRDLNKEKEEELKKSVKVAERENKYAKWGKGLKQVEEAEDRIADYIHEINKPLARYAGDEDLERMLKSREREGDPMLEYIRNKQTESIDIDNKGKPTYKGYYLPNRFNIRPGHRWDGVDRSNGYEKQWFERQNARKALQEEAYKWSTSDM